METHEKHNNKQAMLQFYAMQLKYAHKSIEKLHNENTHLRKETNLLRLGKQSWLANLQQKLDEQHFENQALKNKVKFTQMRMEMLSGGPISSSQPVFPQRQFVSGMGNNSNADNAHSSNDPPIDPSIWSMLNCFTCYLIYFRSILVLSECFQRVSFS